jgi:hypothetical protein
MFGAGPEAAPRTPAHVGSGTAGSRCCSGCHASAGPRKDRRTTTRSARRVIDRAPGGGRSPWRSPVQPTCLDITARAPFDDREIGALVARPGAAPDQSCPLGTGRALGAPRPDGGGRRRCTASRYPAAAVVKPRVDRIIAASDVIAWLVAGRRPDRRRTNGCYTPDEANDAAVARCIVLRRYRSPAARHRLLVQPSTSAAQHRVHQDSEGNARPGTGTR